MHFPKGVLCYPVLVQLAIKALYNAHYCCSWEHLGWFCLHCMLLHCSLKIGVSKNVPISSHKLYTNTGNWYKWAISGTKSGLLNPCFLSLLLFFVWLLLFFPLNQFKTRVTAKPISHLLCQSPQWAFLNITLLAQWSSFKVTFAVIGIST